MMTLPQQFKAARRVSTPLIAIRTPDPGATIAGLAASLNGAGGAVLRWNIVTGLQGANEAWLTAQSG
jgi:hypothetical protein